jgi:hypothetical protein
MRIHFVLVAEGGSDEGLIGPLENLCIDAGATEVTGTAPDFGRLRQGVGHTVLEKLRAAVQLEPSANLFFIHRDSDSTDPEPRYREIAEAVADASLDEAWVAVVPVQETEAWLLLDELRIRRAAGRPNGTVALNLPTATQIEGVANPKERLKAALAAASELSGRRLKKFKAEFSIHRRLLLQALSAAGAIEQLTSWVRLRSDTASTISRMDA